MKKHILAALAAFALLFATAPLQAQVEPTTLGTCLSNLVTLGTVSSNVVNAREITLYQGRGISFSPRFVGTQSTNTGTIAFLFAVSHDGTNYTTTTPIILTSTANATTAVRDWVNIPVSTLDNARKLRLLTITNALVNMGTLHVTNVYYGIK